MFLQGAMNLIRMRIHPNRNVEYHKNSSAIMTVRLRDGFLTTRAAWFFRMTKTRNHNRKKSTEKLSMVITSLWILTAASSSLFSDSKQETALKTAFSYEVPVSFNQTENKTNAPYMWNSERQAVAARINQEVTSPRRTSLTRREAAASRYDDVAEGILEEAKCAARTLASTHSGSRRAASRITFRFLP